MQREPFCSDCGARLATKRVHGLQWHYCERCRLPVAPYPLPVICTVVTDNRQRVLLVKENEGTDTGQWRLPGGSIQRDESPEQSVIRSLKKETGLNGQIELLLGITTDSGETAEPLLMIGYQVTRVSGELFAGNDVAQLAWFHPTDLPSIAFRSHRYFIRIAYAAYTD